MMEDLKKIKKLYGEKMMHLCRELFPTLLEKQGLLSKLMIDNFAPTKFLYEDIIDSGNIEIFKNYIFSLVDEEKNIHQVVNKTPKELLEDAGYILYECKTEREIQKFIKYYAPKEQLCTFYGGRLDRCYVFFALKKNVDEIKRENFPKPKRQDEYGTSVISIQFTKGRINTLSIKNRYNHTVNNPDATYSNNLENIIEGLTESFEKEYNLRINQNTNAGFELLGYVKANDGKYYKYNYEIRNIYYCPNNIIIDNFEVKKLEPEKYVVLDFFVLDLVNKKIMLYDSKIKDSFVDGIKDIERINITKGIDTKLIEILTKDKKKITIELDKTNQIIGYKNDTITHVSSNFLYRNKKMINLELLNLIEVEDNFLHSNSSLIDINMPNLTYVGSNFLAHNLILQNLSLPNLKKAGDNFLYWNEDLEILNLPNLEEANSSFLHENNSLTNISVPNLTRAGSQFLYFNDSLVNMDFSNLTTIGYCFLFSNKKISLENLPKLNEKGRAMLGFDSKQEDSMEEIESLYGNSIKSAKKQKKTTSKELVKANEYNHEEKNNSKK